jgi:ribosomal protein S18 acetylase RimI-like enzyme
MIEIRHATIEDIPTIRYIVDLTWWPTYKNLLSTEQIQYMLDHIYSDESLHAAIENGTQKFFLILENGVVSGFAAYGLRDEDSTIAKLYKLYVLPTHHGKGFGKMLIDKIKKELVNVNLHTLDLNVKRDNPAKTFYEKLGFKIIREEDIPFGPYWLNDYVMRLTF